MMIGEAVTEEEEPGGIASGNHRGKTGGETRPVAETETETGGAWRGGDRGTKRIGFFSFLLLNARARLSYNTQGS